MPQESVGAKTWDTGIESHAATNSIKKTLNIASAVADLKLLSSADMLIGTSQSQFSRIGFYLMVSRTGAVPPYAFLDSPFCSEYSPGMPGWCRQAA